jgi:hypothetical protein
VVATLAAAVVGAEDGKNSTQYSVLSCQEMQRAAAMRPFFFAQVFAAVRTTGA